MKDSEGWVHATCAQPNPRQRIRWGGVCYVYAAQLKDSEAWVLATYVRSNVDYRWLNVYCDLRWTSSFVLLFGYPDLIVL